MPVEKPTAVTMKGDGYYDSHSQVQSSVIQSLVPVINKIIPDIPAPANKQSFCIVDYGCSEGKNSIAVVQAAIEAVRAKRPKELFFVVHEDLPANNFNRLFSQVYSESPEITAANNRAAFSVPPGLLNNSGASIYGATPDSPVFVFASGSTFYSRVVPDDFVHLGVSSSSVHWTSSRPQIKSHIFHAGASIEENREYAKVAASDWIDFLNNRTRELKPGGKMVVTMAARITTDRLEPIDTHGKPPEEQSAQIILQLLYDVLQQLVTEKWISSSALERFVMPIYCRSRAEILDPISETRLVDELNVEHFVIEWVRCPIHAQYKKDGDVIRYAEGLTGILRAFSEPMLVSQLFGVTDRRKSGRESFGKEAVVDLIYERVRNQISEAPDRYTFYPCHATLVFSKRNPT